MPAALELLELLDLELEHWAAAPGTGTGTHGINLTLDSFGHAASTAPGRGPRPMYPTQRPAVPGAP